MMVSAVFLLNPVTYAVFNFIVGPVVDKFVSKFDHLEAECENLFLHFYFRDIIDGSLSSALG